MPARDETPPAGRRFALTEPDPYRDRTDGVRDGLVAPPRAPSGYGYERSVLRPVRS
jgi:hypothetical protein